MSRSRASSSKKASTSSTSSARGVDTSALESFYDSLKDEDDPEVLDMDCISRLGEMLGMDPASDVRLLVLMWKLGAKSAPRSLTKDEFMRGMTSLNVSTAPQLSALLPTLDPGFLEKSEFRDYYKFVFQFFREGTHKTIEKAQVMGLLNIVLDINRAPHLEHFLEFLEADTDNPRITLDQWDSFLQFNQQIDVELATYEDEGAWPLLLDEYVEWRKKK